MRQRFDLAGINWFTLFSLSRTRWYLFGSRDRRSGSGRRTGVRGAADSSSPEHRRSASQPILNFHDRQCLHQDKLYSGRGAFTIMHRLYLWPLGPLLPADPSHGLSIWTAYSLLALHVGRNEVGEVL